MSNNLGRILKQRRVMVPLTLQLLARASGVSASHLGRIERGERYPSAHVLRKIARPLGSEESELFTLAGYLSPQPETTFGDPQLKYQLAQVDKLPEVARKLIISIIEAALRLEKGSDCDRRKSIISIIEAVLKLAKRSDPDTRLVE